MENFIFNKIDKERIKKNNNIIDNSFNFESTFFIDTGCIQALKNNLRESYKTIGDNYLNNKEIFSIEKYENDYIELNNSFVNADGLIKTELNMNNTYINGGCLCGKINYIFNHDNVKKYDTVISITSMWSSGIWHFPYEAFVALMSVPKDILQNCKIHVSKITNYIIQWFELLNISQTSLITGDIYANTLYIPRMGKCGNPYYSQIKWLKSVVNSNLLKMEKPNEYIILIKRNNRRRLRNYNDLERLLKNFCKKTKYDLYIHDDNHLPSLLEQQKIFNNSKVVFAPHGAGGINMISMKKTSLYVEFLSVQNINLCYSRLAYLCGINYIGISMSNSKVDLNKIIQLLIKIKREI